MKNLLKKKIQNFLGLTSLKEENKKILKNLGIINSKDPKIPNPKVKSQNKTLFSLIIPVPATFRISYEKL